MKIIKILCLFGAAAASALSLFAEAKPSDEKAASREVSEKSVNWFLDIKKAEKQAAKEGKPLIIFFTGSDWCIWCKKLVHETISKPEFVDYANKNFVMLLCDFPNEGADKEQIAKNSELASAFKIEGFPTLVLLDIKNKKAFNFGYSEANTPQKFIDYVKKTMEKSNAAK